MGAYLDRYLRGECEAVWGELTALGAAVRDEPLRSDATAVAHETMRRARANIETLIPRLVQIGYRWAQPCIRDQMVEPYTVNRAPIIGRFVSGLEVPPDTHEPYTFADRMAYEEFLDMARDMPPPFLPADDREERISAFDRRIAALDEDAATWREQLRQMRAAQEARPTARSRVAELESLAGPTPLSVRAWHETVGGVNFAGDHDGWRASLPRSGETTTDPADYIHPFVALEPLFVFALDDRELSSIQPWANRGTSQAHTLLAEDRYKYLQPSNDPYYVRLPGATADQ